MDAYIHPGMKRSAAFVALTAQNALQGQQNTQKRKRKIVGGVEWVHIRAMGPIQVKALYLILNMYFLY
jgi:hypothetical protein